MKVQPQAYYPTPAYPTVDQVHQDGTLLFRIPKRWQRLSCCSKLAGLGLWVRAMMAGTLAVPAVLAETTSPTQTVQADQNDVREKSRSKRTVIAPVWAEALAHDGRGAFGCIAVNPPTYLPESEAIELIQKELRAAGLSVKANVALDDVMSPSKKEPPKVDDPKERREKMTQGRPLELQPFVFPLADTERAIYIEYFSLSDYHMWMGRSMMSVQSFDFAKLIKKASAAFAQRKSVQPVHIGLFFNPMARLGKDYQRPAAGYERVNGKLTEEALRVIRKEQELRKDLAKQRLQGQIQYFIAHLRKEGLLPEEITVAPEASDASNPTPDQSL